MRQLVQSREGALSALIVDAAMETGHFPASPAIAPYLENDLNFKSSPQELHPSFTFL